ncbi:hypothetical protein [Legionella spiritensis]|uniref:hypothetical protein n=1 Tax=Legionella spiritensis TaxID=452 RepID=UPI000F6C9BB8|nr:hypothetical protein [Legionella spiritensis]VEG91107.1 Uncharacterised protein [Legionella spiritensis]
MSMLPLFKSSFDGIGTGAGVAWPFFGILSSTLGLVAGGTIALIAGSVAGLLFCLISGAIFYLSYRNACKEEVRLQQKAAQYQDTLNTLIVLYLKNIYQECLFHAQPDMPLDISTLSRLLHQKIKQDYATNRYVNDASTNQLLLRLLGKQSQQTIIPIFIAEKWKFGHGKGLLPSMTPENPLNIAINDLTTQHIQAMTVPSPTSLQFKAAFISGAGTFGAIAGCAAGFAGLLTGLGLFAGFAAIPILGWATLILALGTALLIASCSAQQALARHQLQAKGKTIKLMNRQLETINCTREIDLHTDRLVKEKLEKYQYDTVSSNRHFFTPCAIQSGQTPDPLAVSHFKIG